MKHRRAIRPRKVVIRAGIFLLLITGGAIVNIAVAWSIASFAGAIPIREGFYSQLSSQAANACWLRHAPADWHDVSLLEGNAVESWAFGRADLLMIAEDAGRGRLVAVGHHDAGWPSLALRLTGRYVVQQGAQQAELRWGWQMNVSWLRSGILPLLPVWPGFAINTLFYAAMLWLLLALPGALRRRLRLKRGLCPACAYPVGTSAVCTECGRPIPARLRGRVERAS